MAEHAVAGADEIGEGERIVVEVEGREVGVFRLDGEYYAYANYCPHQSGPVCEGPRTGRQEQTFDRETLESELRWSREGEILVCPWHAWEFDLETGENLPEREVRLPSYPVRVEDGEVVIEV